MSIFRKSEVKPESQPEVRVEGDEIIIDPKEENPSPKPEILGREAAGDIVALDPNVPAPFRLGDRVACIGTGAYAEYSCTVAAKAALVPSSISSSDAAASLLQGLTALTLVREAYAVKPGEFVLVHAAAGGVGLWLCQILKAIGARTIGTTSTAAKAELARKNGAEFVVDYSQEDVGPDAPGPWSPCGGGQMLWMASQIEVDNHGHRGAGGQLTVDSIDTELQWRRCQ